MVVDVKNMPMCIVVCVFTVGCRNASVEQSRLKIAIIDAHNHSTFAANDEIEAYHWNTHTIRLTDSAIARMRGISTQNPRPIAGLLIGNEIVYRGYIATEQDKPPPCITFVLTTDNQVAVFVGIPRDENVGAVRQRIPDVRNNPGLWDALLKSGRLEYDP